MYQETTINFHEDISMTTIPHQKLSDIRAKSVDYPRIASPSISSFKTRSSTIYIDELRRIEEADQRGLNILNTRFANYLDEIKTLGDKNIHLRRQIDDIHKKYLEPIEEEIQIDEKNYHSSEMKFNHLRQELKNESRKLITSQICLQRANHDRKYFKDKLKFFSTTEQIQLMKQQLHAGLEELNLLKEQYQKEEQNLRFYKNQYNDYLTTLIGYTNECDTITFARIQSENYLYTLKEQLLFEHEYNQQCKQEFEYLEKIQYDSNNHFNKTEFDNIIRKIRQDYQKYNEIQLSEFELTYKIKLDSMENDLYPDKKEHHSEEIKPLIEQNRLLQQKLKQLEINLHHLTEQNREQYEILDQEYHQLENQLPKFESFIQDSRDSTVHLTSEINTYRCLLTNLVQKPQIKPADFTVHFGNGIIWVRI